MTWPGPPDLAEGERIALDVGIEEGDLEGAVGDGSGLPDELAEPLFGATHVRLGAVPLHPDLTLSSPISTGREPRFRQFRDTNGGTALFAGLAGKRGLDLALVSLTGKVTWPY
jgi:hypothetical protein